MSRYTFKDFATGKVRYTRGRFVGWSKPQGPLAVRYACFENRASVVHVPEYCLTTETLDILPGEGDEQTVRSLRARRECDVCSNPAHFKVTYLLKNCRTNPASKAYGRDDCSWCADGEAFACREHVDEVERDCPPGMSLCSIIPATGTFAHMFLSWEQSK